MIEGITNKKPPDIYKTYKHSFHKIIRLDPEDVMKDKINDAVVRTNLIVSRTYKVLRLYLLKQHNEYKNMFSFTDKENVKILDDLIRSFFTVTCQKGQGKQKKVKQELVDFYQNEYLPLQVSEELYIKRNLNQTLNYEIKKMITCYKNNITANYFNYLFRYINTVFDYKTNEEYLSLLTKASKEEIKEYKNQHFGQLKKVKQDLLKGTFDSEPTYHEWIRSNRERIVPLEYEKSIPFDLKCNPLRYIQFMVNMVQKLEESEKKLFQIFPIRTNITLKHIDIDTKSLVELSNLKDKKIYLDDIKGYKEFLWNKYFKMKYMKDKKNYKFNDRIQTDGVSVSLSYIQYEHYGRKNVRQKKLKELPVEFPYIDEVDYDALCSHSEKNNIVFIDPGKNNLLYCKDKLNVYFRYTKNQRVKETERIIIQNKLLKLKKKHKIQEQESILSTHNSKTLNYEKFKEYIKVKEKLDNDLHDFYCQEYLRKFKRRLYINTQRSESKLIKNLKEKYNDSTFVIGNWNITKQMRHFISTPCIGLKRLLAKHFNVLTMDEFRTSCLSHIDNTKVNNLQITNAMRHETKKVSLHPVLMLTQKNGRMGCISRDKNAVINFEKIFNQYLKDKTRPKPFCRSTISSRRKAFKQSTTPQGDKVVSK